MFPYVPAHASGVRPVAFDHTETGRSQSEVAEADHKPMQAIAVESVGEGKGFNARRPTFTERSWKDPGKILERSRGSRGGVRRDE